MAVIGFAYADALRVQSTLSGHPVALDPNQLARTVAKDPLKQRAADDAHDKALLEIAGDTQAGM